MRIALAVSVVLGMAVAAGAQQGGGRGCGMAAGRGSCRGGGPDMARVTTYSGAVERFSGGAGEGMPTLSLATAAGTVEVLASPYRALRSSGVELAPGKGVEVTAAPVVVDGADQWVALTIKDVASGTVVVLRDAQTGIPLGGRRGRGRGCSRMQP